MSALAISLPSHAMDLTSQKQDFALLAPLVAAVRIGVADQALIIGRNVIEQMAALVRAGCNSISLLRAEAAYPRDEQVDVLWLVGIDNALDRIASALKGKSIPRAVIIEGCGAEADGRFQSVFQHLRANGFVHFNTYHNGRNDALLAARPAWLQQVV